MSAPPSNPAGPVLDTLVALALRLRNLLLDNTPSIVESDHPLRKEALGAPLVTIAELLKHADEESKRIEKRMQVESVSEEVLPHLQRALDAACRPVPVRERKELANLPEELVDSILHFVCQLEEEGDDDLEGLVRHGYDEEWGAPLIGCVALLACFVVRLRLWFTALEKSISEG